MKIELPEAQGFDWVEVPWLDWKKTRSFEGALVAHDGVTKYYKLIPAPPTPSPKQYNWSKTGRNVLVRDIDGSMRAKSECVDCQIAALITGFWQAHTGNVCPVDPQATMVEVVGSDMSVAPGLAANKDWNNIIHFRVIGLAEGYEYP